MKLIPSFLIAVILVGVIAVPVGIKVLTKHLNHSGTPTVVVAPVTEGSTTSTILAEGSIVPVSVANVSLQPGVDGLVTNIYANVGQHVTQGEVLAVLDSQIQLQNLQKAQAALATAKSNYNLVVKPYRPEQIEQMRLKLQGDRDAVREEQERLTILLNGSRPQDIAQAQADVDSATAQLSLAQSQDARNQQLYAQNLIPKADYEASKTAVLLATDSLTKATQALSLVKEGPRQEDIAVQRASLQASQATLATDAEQYAIMMEGPRADDVAEAAANLASAQTEYDQENLYYSRRYLRSPISGWIEERNVSIGDYVAPASASASGVNPLVQSNASLFVIQSDSGVQFIANVDQMFYNKVTVNEPVTVTVESLPGRTFQGRIYTVTPMINSDLGARSGSGASTNPLTPFTFNVVATVDNPHKLLVPGQVGQIKVQTVSHGLIVPAAAVTSYSVGYGTVYVEANNVVHVRSIYYDETTDGQIRVISGLNNGDNVVVSQSGLLTDNMHVAATIAPLDDLGEQPQPKSS